MQHKQRLADARHHSNPSTPTLHRFAALDFSSEDLKSSAIALTVGGAMLPVFIGPETSRHVRDALPTPFLGYFILAACLRTAQ